MENLEEKLGAKTHYNLMNGKTVTQNVPQLPAKSKKEFDTQISKETQLSAISDRDSDFSEAEDAADRAAHCIWHRKIIYLVKNIYFLFLENIYYRVAGQRCD